MIIVYILIGLAIVCLGLALYHNHMGTRPISDE
jgi:hypothetical protein